MRKLIAAIMFSMLAPSSYSQDMVQVAGGTFWMGQGTSKDLTYWPHPVTLSTFRIDKFETTYDTWKKVRDWGLLHGYTDLGYGLNGCSGDGSDVRLPSTSGPNNPVTCVYWYDAVKWCNARSEMDSLNPVYFTDNTLATVYRTGQLMLNPDAVKWSANGYRLPTEAEWEFAARGGTKSNNYTYSGSNAPDDVAWYSLNSGEMTHPVGQRAPNELGIYDMSGNVAEMCWDWYRPYDTTAQVDPHGQTVLYPALYHRVQRGGSYNASPLSCPSTQIATGYIPSENNWWGWLGFRCVGSPNPKLSIVDPANQEVILANSLYPIKWNSTSVDSINITYSIDGGKTFQPITQGVRAIDGTFAWQVPDILSSKCVMVIRNLHNPLDSAINSNFKIKGYILTRFKANGDYEAFDPALHGWQFDNSSETMWPETWWNQFNYVGTDPNTADKYPAEFTDSRFSIFAHRFDFPDWPLFSHTFGIDRCYGTMSPPVYSPSAERFWARIKGNHKGSCFGFAVGSLLEFDFPDAFRAFFPQLGSYTNLIELPVNDYRRAVINQLFQYQFGFAVQTFERSRHLRTPRETLQDAKDNFLSPAANHRGLTLLHHYTLSGMPGGHEVVPYALKRISNTSIFQLLVYDSNCPTGTCPDYGNPVVLIDSALNSWSYPPLQWGSGVAFLGLYLDSPANTYLVRPIFSEYDADSVETLAGQPVLQVMNTNSAAITVTDSTGNTIGFADSTGINTIPNASPIIPRSGFTEAPIGYFVPAGAYSITLKAFRDSAASVAVFGKSSVFSYSRSDAVSGQTDHLSYGAGLGVRNVDGQTKRVNLEAITRLRAGERGFQVLNCATTLNDSLKIATPDTNRMVFVNYGGTKTYDLNVVLAGANSSGQFSHDNITVAAHSTQFIVPNWGDLDHQPVKIYQDRGNTGTISDSLLVSNQATGIREQSNSAIPREFSLEQNYPNPFNPTTTIRYGLAHRCQVTLTVFNTLGQELAVLQSGEQEAGFHDVRFDGSKLASGVYFYRIQTAEFTRTCKMLLMK